MIIEKLKLAGFRITAPRKAVIEYLVKNHKPRSAQEIHVKLKNADLVSVYRVLEVLEEIGVVQHDDLNGKAYYYLAEDAHHHISCRECGRVQCIPCDHLFETIKGFKDIKHQITLIGTCSACAK